MRSTSSLPTLERLRRIPGLESSPTAELIALDSLAGECRLFAGRVVVRRGCVPRHVLLIASGAVEVTSDDLPEPEIVGGGGLVGLRPVLQGADHSEQVVVVTDANVLVIKREVLDRFLALPSIERLVDRCVAHLPMPQPGQVGQVGQPTSPRAVGSELGASAGGDDGMP
jgi:CRP-like cAMP-binding protein